MIRRERDPALLEVIAKRPEVRPFILFHDGPVDWWQIVKGCCVLSNGKDAMAIFEEREPRVWEGHIMFAQTCRGKEAQEVAKQMVSWLLPEHADAIFGAIPKDNRAARMFMRRIGFQPVSDPQSEVELFYMRAQ